MIVAALPLERGLASAKEGDRAFPAIAKPIEGSLPNNRFILKPEFGPFHFRREQALAIHLHARPHQPTTLTTRDKDRLSGHLACEGFDFETKGRGRVQLGRRAIHRPILAAPCA